jgi:two-component system alkaline phosphatase synthesis response regulator PhoP
MEHLAPRVLVVDDLPDMRAVFVLTLRRTGWEVLEAGDGVEAIEAAHVYHPDVILMDYNMPVLDGIEACRQIKNQPAFNDTPVLIYTGAFASNVRDAALNAGAEAFLTKPILPTDLRDEVYKAYEKYHGPLT